ncbi:hypothetical protein [Nesterenkonia natronophila]|uniref:Gram-positive cocci surface proteins LPxTG domain-containing protein n=1 Tax=Nesterenkonia natronophila TaxID=2174932 RepID=A0A3A4G3C4_9MICC|nr:hypothetical protein [Nesterenkonia natronophila]RJN32769.1 hypothetical protein D3250_02810 [Nesterenkonia natronophila]
MLSGSSGGPVRFPVRIFSALALTAGLMLSSAGVALATEGPEETQTFSEADEETSPTPSPTEGTEDPQVNDDEVTDDPQGEEDEVGDDTAEGEGDDLEENGGSTFDEDEDEAATLSPTPTPPTPTPTPTPPQGPEVDVNCTNITIEAGQSARITCSTDPAGATLSLGTTSSQIGGTITVEGNQVQYQAPIEGSGEDNFTVIARAPDYDDGRTGLTVRVTPPTGGTDSPAPTAPTETLPPSPSPSPNSTTSAPPEEASTPPQNTENNAIPPTEETPPEAENPPANEPTASAPPNTPDAPEPEDDLVLPVPGMPNLPELAIPSVILEPEPEATDDHHYDSLAATGTSAAFGAAGLGVLTLALGAGMLLTSRRLR